MTKPITPGAVTSVPAHYVLPLGTVPYRRALLQGRVVSVYYDRHPPDDWGEHSHELIQATFILNHTTILVSWLTPDGIWHQMELEGPAMWLVPCGMKHKVSSRKEADIVTLLMLREFAHETVGHEIVDFVSEPFARLASRDTVIGQLGKTFRTLCVGHEKVHSLYVESIGLVLATHLLKTLFRASGSRRAGLSPETMLRVMRYIDDHLSGPIRLNTLAKLAGVCRSYFTELFKRSVGHTAHDYIMRRRVAKAQELLETTAMKEVDIAGLCGFSDDTMMARWFKKILDCKPKDIRMKRPR